MACLAARAPYMQWPGARKHKRLVTRIVSRIKRMRVRIHEVPWWLIWVALNMKRICGPVGMASRLIRLCILLIGRHAASIDSYPCQCTLCDSCSFWSNSAYCFLLHILQSPCASWPSLCCWHRLCASCMLVVLDIFYMPPFSAQCPCHEPVCGVVSDTILSSVLHLHAVFLWTLDSAT